MNAYQCKLMKLSLYCIFQTQLHKCFDKLVSDLLDMLNKDVAENIKTCSQYFWLLHMYVQMVGTDNQYRSFQSGMSGSKLNALIVMVFFPVFD